MESTKPIIEFYDKLGQVVKINAEDSVEEVYKVIKTKVASI